MAIIGKIRKKSTLLLVIVGLALLSFIFTTYDKGNGGNGNKVDLETIAKIDGEKMSRSEFLERIELTTEGLKQQQGKSSVTNEESYQIMTQVWDQMKKEFILDQECIKLGLLMDNGFDEKPTISMKELNELLQGNYPHQYILQNFSDPQTGKFNPNAVVGFLNDLQQGKKSQNPEERERWLKSETQWKNLEQYIKKDRVVEKYNALLQKSYYMPKAIAEIDQKNRTENMVIRYFGIRYSTISDSAVKVSDADYQKYYDAHKNEFKQKEETRLVDYVVWNVRPSAEDIQKTEEEVNVIKNDFSTIDKENLASFISRNSDSRFDTNWTSKGKLSVFIDSIAFNSPIGSVLGPWQEKEAYHLAKIMDVQLRPDSMRASHILISYAGAMRAAEGVTRTKIQSKEMADSLYKMVKANPAAFEELAGTVSDDAAAKSKMGDLDWFVDGAMITEFNDACVKGKVGDVVLVETPFGNHILKITGKKEPVKKVKIAIVDKRLVYSNATYNKVFGEATKFVAITPDSAAFEKNTTDKGIQVMHSNELRIMDNSIQGLPGSRTAVQWTFNEETEVGQVSELFTYDNIICVAVLKKIKQKGISPLEDIKEYIKPLVIREVKAEKMLKDNKVVGSDLSAMAAKYNVVVDTFRNFNFSQYSLPTYGPEMYFQGRISAMKPNKIYGPIKGDQGIYFVIIDEKTPAVPSTDNLMSVRSQAQMMYSQRITNYMDKFGEAFKAIEDNVEIEDFRQFFY